MENPFDHLRPSDPTAFLDRDEERRRLRDYVDSGRNVLIYGPRRRGKTSLITRVLWDLPDELVGIHVDLLGCIDEQDLAGRVLGAFNATGLAATKRFTKWLQGAVADLEEIEITIGAKGASLRVRRGQSNRPGLDEAWTFLERCADGLGLRLILALDEFQDVMGLPDVVSTLRRRAQATRAVQILLSGSAPSTLAWLQDDKASPFYQQLTTMQIHGLTIHDLRADAEAYLPAPLTDDQADQLAAVTGTNTKRVVQLLRHFHALQDVEASIEAALWENATDYERILSQVKPGNQRRVLYAMAMDQPVHPTGGDFLIRHRLGVPENVRNALKALRSLEVLGEDNTFLDPLFRFHLQQSQG